LAGWLWNLSCPCLIQKSTWSILKQQILLHFLNIKVSFTDKFKGEIVVLVSFYSAKFKVKATASK